MRARQSEKWQTREAFRGRLLATAWAAWLGALPWELFVVLTFDPKRVFPVSGDLASKETFWWCGQTARVHRRPVGWLYGIERGRSGQCHAHVLMMGLRGELGPAPEALWQQRNGRIDIQPVHHSGGAVLYTTKEAARTGEVVVSDTLRSYLGRDRRDVLVSLHPSAE